MWTQNRFIEIQSVSSRMGFQTDPRWENWEGWIYFEAGEEGWSDMLRYVHFIYDFILDFICFLFVLLWGDPFGYEPVQVITVASRVPWPRLNKTLDVGTLSRWLSHAFCSPKSFAGRNSRAVGSFGAVRRPPWAPATTSSYFVTCEILWSHWILIEFSVYLCVFVYLSLTSEAVDSEL